MKNVFFRALRKAARQVGYDLRPRVGDGQAGYTLHGYLDEEGNFDYETYRQVQEDGNKLKLDRVWAQQENIEFLADYIRTLVPNASFGLCHGTRRGKEQEWFRNALGCEVIGTEISETATQFPHTIQWDFHEIKDEWVDGVDFIYSNSFDHSYDPEHCINQWMRCIKPGGVCILEHSSLHGPDGVQEMDPFGAEIFIMPYLILQWGAGRFAVREVLNAPLSPEHLNLKYLQYMVIART